VKDSKVIVDALLGDEADPKEMASKIELGSDLFEEFMQNYRNECLKLLKSAQASGALAGDEPEGLVIRAVMQIAVKNFVGWTPGSRQVLKNLEKFL
jgi:hypothetical protein